jgi:drug/metabolite transporter (DMT)-like permease
MGSDPSPRVGALLGALTIAFSAILVKASDVAPATSAFFRCFYAVPVLWLLARGHERTPRQRRLAYLAGLLFAVDLVAWHYSIAYIGAGLATVLGNLQVVLVGLTAWLILSERPEARVVAAVPPALIGIVLISGAFEDGAYGSDPTQGAIYGVITAISYTAFILLIRESGTGVAPAPPLYEATWVAAVGCAVAGIAIGDVSFAPSWPEHGWLLLLALSSQVVGWLLITGSLPKLPAAVTSVLLTLQPLTSLGLGVVLLGEEPSGLQLVGAALVLWGLLTAATPPGALSSRSRRARRAAAPPSSLPYPGRSDPGASSANPAGPAR